MNRQQRLYQRRLRDGVCTRCGKAREQPDKARCTACRVHVNRENSRRRTMLHAPPHCECGRGRKLGGEMSACRLCTEMDGSGEAQFDVIQVLRAAEGPLSPTALAAELGISANTAGQTLLRLARLGVIRKRVIEEDAGGWANRSFVEYYIAGKR